LTGFVLVISPGTGWPEWWQVVAWFGWSAVLVGTTWREHTGWMDTDARLTADPSSHTYGAGTRLLTLFTVAMLCGFLPWAPALVAVFALGEVLALRHVQRREQAVAELREADPRGTPLPGKPSAPTVNQRLPQPDPHWTPDPGWTPPAGWYGPVPGWERQTDGTWRRTPEHPLHGASDPEAEPG